MLVEFTERARAESYRFGAFEVDLRAAELRKGGTRVRLQRQPLRLLAVLLRRAGQLVTREELQQELWPDGTVVEFEHGLNNAINRLREALGDDADTPRYVERLPRRGYRFLAPVERVGPLPAASTPAGAFREGAPSRPRRAGVLYAMLVGAALLFVGPARLQEGSPRRMLAVLPFRDLGVAPDREYFADGLTEELIARLGRLEPARLGVIARTSTMAYRGTSKRVDEIGRELGVDYVLEGSIRRSDRRFRVTAQLSRVSDQTLVWSRDSDCDIDDLLEVQREVGHSVATQVGLRLGAGDPRARDSLAPGSESYDLVLKGRYELNRRSEEGLRRALEHFRRALDTQPRDPRALAGLAASYLLLGAGDYGVLSARDAMPRAKAAALEALQVDPGLAEAHATLAFVAYVYEWDWTTAEHEFRAALAADPNYVPAHHWYALYLKAVGRRQEALAEFDRALALDPLSLIVAADRGWSLYQLGDNETAIAQYARLLDRAPDFAPARWSLGLAELRKGRAGNAIDQLRQAVSLTGENPARLAELGYAYGVTGRRQEAVRIYEQLQALSQRRRVSSGDLAWVQIGLGHRDRAFELLERAYAERSCLFLNLKLDPRLDPLREDPRFRDLLGRLAFPS